MRICFCLLVAAAASLLSVLPGGGQVLYSYDFDTATNFQFQTYMTISPPVSPIITYGNFDTGGPPHGSVLKVTVDASNQTTGWYACWQGFPVRLALTNCLPVNSFLKFDLITGLARPVHVRLQYCGSDCRDSDTDVTPATAGTFQTFLLPVSSFTNTDYVIGGQGPSPLPTCFEFGIRGDPANPDATWPCAATNMFMVDNIEYVTAPPLSIDNANHALVISWATNTQGFVLEQSSNPGAGPWTAVTNACVVTNGQKQVAAPAAESQRFYRLVEP